MAAQPKGRPKSPADVFDLETGVKVLEPKAETIEVKVDTPIPPSEPLIKYIHPKDGGKSKKSRKQKKRVHKKTQKRRARK